MDTGAGENVVAAGGERIARKRGGPAGKEAGSRRQEDRRQPMPAVWLRGEE